MTLLWPIRPRSIHFPKLESPQQDEEEDDLLLQSSLGVNGYEFIIYILILVLGG